MLNNPKEDKEPKFKDIQIIDFLKVNDNMSGSLCDPDILSIKS